MLKIDFPGFLEYFHSEWKCPKCEDEEHVCDHGRISLSEDPTIDFHCYECGYKEEYKITLKLEKILEVGAEKH